MVAGGFHPRQLFSINTAGILMKSENWPELFYKIN